MNARVSAIHRPGLSHHTVCPFLISFFSFFIYLKDSSFKMLVLLPKRSQMIDAVKMSEALCSGQENQTDSLSLTTADI